ncbi:MAG: DUF1836 domain-containing protein [Clostridia bacterium]|nr:DUF1836 domain-containing protein [Clostridia bacterium]
MQEKLIPGTVLHYSDESGIFSVFKPMITAAKGLTLGQVCSITGLSPSTIQNWVKRGFVAHPINKKYFSRQLARILLISSLRECMQIDRIGELMKMVNGSADDESDDIISEEALYEYFCEIIRCMDSQGTFHTEAKEIIERTISEYTGPDSGAKERLTLALLTMVSTYMSGKLKQEADGYFNKIKELSEK